jgi:hypothetical protein
VAFGFLPPVTAASTLKDKCLEPMFEIAVKAQTNAAIMLMSDYFTTLSRTCTKRIVGKKR